MAIRRAMAVVVALVMTATFAAAQQAQQQAPKRNKQEQQELERIVKAVDDVMAGQPAPADSTIALEPFFFRAADNKMFVPMVLTITNAPKTDSVMLIRIAPAGATFNPKERKKVEYPWEDAHFLTAAHVTGEPARLTRGFMAPAGTYDLYIALKERLPEKAPKNAVAKTTVHKSSITVPDFFNGELSISSIMVVDKVNNLTAPLTPLEARERPLVFGATEIVPVSDMEFKKSEEFNLNFQIYNAGLDANGKPDLVLEYEFFRADGAEEKPFNKTNPQTVNASNIPPNYDASKFPLPGGIGIPLTSFPEGSYRLAMKITDKVSGKVLTKDMKFTVKG